MKLIEAIPIGSKYKLTREELMYKTKIMDIRQFRKEITELRKQYIIIFDNGYYLPSSKEEYIEFIKQLNEEIYDKTKTIQLAYKEMGEKEKV